MLWGVGVDYELVVPPLGASRPIVPAAFHLELLRTLLDAYPGNAITLRDVIARRVSTDAFSSEDLIATAAELITHGELALREHPRPESAAAGRDRAPRESPGIPLRLLAKDRPYEPPPTTFVAFIVVDQDGRPLSGRFHCRIDGKPHDGELPGDVVEFTEIRSAARADVSFDDLAMPDDAENAS